MPMSPQDERILKERVDTLVGVRGKPEMAAMRRGEAKPLAAAADKIRKAAAVTLADLTSADVSAAPTQSDFNALRADVQSLHAALARIIAALE